MGSSGEVSTNVGKCYALETSSSTLLTRSFRTVYQK